MVFPSVLYRLIEWLLYHLLGNSCYIAARKVKNYGFFLAKNPSFKTNIQQQEQQPHQQHDQNSRSYPNLSKHLDVVVDHSCKSTMACDINGTLLRTESFFPYFMLVAFEGGNLIRALLLLLCCPLLGVLDHELQLKVMIFVTFCGLKIKDMKCVERAVLPKFFMEDLNYHAYQVLCRAKFKAVFTSVPSVMVHGFLTEYLKVDHVVGTELQTFGRYFTGLLSNSGLVSKHKAVKEYFGDKSPDIGIGNSTFSDQLFLSYCKDAYMVNLQEDAKTGRVPSSKMPRNKYPKNIIFHDGRLAFLPTPTATLCMFIWFPLGIILAIYRICVGIYLPFNLGRMLGQFGGVKIRFKGLNTNLNSSTDHFDQGHKGVLYVCTHRTLLDPVMLGLCLGKKLTAVTYSLSKTSEIIAPLRTVRLTRDRETDGKMMEKLLSEGDLVVCPEGTTCREPYLLRFSSLFAELADQIVPVALETKVSMFYGTTASGLKCLDPIFFLMNPTPMYYVHVLGQVPPTETCAGGRSSVYVANNLQRQLAHALGFECTTLTRKDKYLMLAGNEGRVGP